VTLVTVCIVIIVGVLMAIVAIILAIVILMDVAVIMTITAGKSGATLQLSIRNVLNIGVTFRSGSTAYPAQSGLDERDATTGVRS
jgi:hypothetical protein